MTRKTALITGASSGIGLDLTWLFAKDGYDVVLVARSEETLRKLAAELERDAGIRATVIAADLADPKAPFAVFEKTVAQGIAIEALVNNAGFGLTGRFADNDLETELRMIQLNISALTALTKLFLPPMLQRGRGQILNLASTASFQPGPLMAVYYATKAYVLSFSEAIADELRDTGVTVTALCPGPTETQFAETAHMERSRLFTLRKPMDSTEVAKVGYRAMQKGRRVVIAGVGNKLLAQSVRVSPRRLVTTIVRKLQERKG